MIIKFTHKQTKKLKHDIYLCINKMIMIIKIVIKEHSVAILFLVVTFKHETN